jgi:hypothetical protein
VPKFELYKHNDELFNIYYRIPFEEISIFSNGGHLGYRTGLTDTIIKGDHLRIISAKFGWNWLSSFRGEDFFLISSPLFRKCPNLNCISIMMNFLTYITGFFMNFELLPILTDYEIKKKGGWN